MHSSLPPESEKGQGHHVLMTATSWVDQIVKAKQVKDGGVVRRAVADVERLDAFEEIDRRAKLNGWDAIETGDQLIVLCHKGHLTIHC